ncbi:hypothetical protein [Clostridium felsineum]|uniref:hypothetical protein n=1 Tax=Clostridium felsineum TaxID=36839 RepID=UPI00098C5508|nr:hypothetical protein [Clostridium felsineum]URZ03021.1 hypothetical protein CLAUR_030670 [Clostridium felsineum]
MADRRRLCIKANNRSTSVVNRHLNETMSNSFEYFEETVRGKRRAYWDTELEIKVEELYRVGVYEPIYELLLEKNGVVEQWAEMLGNRIEIDWCELFSDFQLHLFNMLDGVSNKTYNREISFMNNLYKQLECLSKDKWRYYNAKKRKNIWNLIPEGKLNRISDIKNEYVDKELLMDLQNLDCLEADRSILIRLATDEICKKDIPTVLGWKNKNNRMKLSRYMRKLSNVIP